MDGFPSADTPVGGSSNGWTRLGWQGSQIDFEVKGRRGERREATAWDEDVCVGKFTTRSGFVLWLRLWIWHFRFNRRGSA